jgi:hypothetical protein
LCPLSLRFHYPSLFASSNHLVPSSHSTCSLLFNMTGSHWQHQPRVNGRFAAQCATISAPTHSPDSSSLLDTKSDLLTTPTSTVNSLPIPTPHPLLQDITLQSPVFLPASPPTRVATPQPVSATPVPKKAPNMANVMNIKPFGGELDGNVQPKDFLKTFRRMM